MYFPAAGIEVSPWIPPLVAFGISLLTSSGGISGAVLLLPYQMSYLGYVNPSVSATNHFFNMVAIPSGVYRYCREGRMIWPLAWVIVAGTLPGALVGAVARVRYLPDPDHFRLFAACVLFYLGSRLLKDIDWKSDLFPAQKTNGAPPDETNSGAKGSQGGAAGDWTIQDLKFGWNRLRYRFQGTEYGVSVVGLFFLSLVVGLVGGIYGIGGGAIIVPFLVTFFKLPVHSVAGAALMGTCVTSTASVLFYQILAPFCPGFSVAPDWLLGALFGLGGLGGMYVGARLQKFLPAPAIKAIVCFILLLTAIRYVSATLNLGALMD
ncbi:MAG TPA: sulfite exporter TauE/SafE family protein [Candidatus Sumerlaeota bacterium]|nr:sulfite exporter TauE/SafE family protein [Candidatus Sumerlaeota bacterium]